MKRNRRIPGLEPYRRPAPQGDYFSDLPYEAQQCAQRLLWQWCKKWGTDLPPWRLAILVARARRLALHPLNSAWGKRMRCRRGGLASQKDYRLRGIDPTAMATEAPPKVAIQSAASPNASGCDLHSAARCVSGTNYDELRFAAVSYTSLHEETSVQKEQRT